MTEIQFWELIRLSKKESEGDDQKQLEALKIRLGELPNEEIYAFDNLLQKYYKASYTSHLWCVAYIVLGGCSDAGFDHFRGWLIAQGQEVYENALESPDSLLPVFDKLRRGNRVYSK